ncbi:MAG: PH domain-containing protein [Planctomycetes bacterium]|nr:PH domain-containing protein [Planctomycetota bacterium]
MSSPSTPLPQPEQADGASPDVASSDAGAASAPASLADGRARRLDPRYVACARIGEGIFAAVVLVSGALGLTFLALAREPNACRLVFLGLVLLAGVGLAAGAAWFHPPLKYTRSTWRLTSFGLEIRRGVWFRHWISVPRARVQHTDVERGPLARRFGLATLVVHTAGQQDSEVRLEGLAHETALAIRDHLLAGGAETAPAEGDGA